jgi:hypothetical protein
MRPQKRRDGIVRHLDAMPRKHLSRYRPNACTGSLKLFHFAFVWRKLGMKRLTTDCNNFSAHINSIVTTFFR